jgi:alpha-amylase/alpha-mannosidase (GH57 family)
MTTALIVHGHFYQPPRENPWTDSVNREPSAHPYHDWNERIHHECYRANAFSRIVDRYGRIERIVNNYENISFNFGPTLLTWLERHHPQTYARILEADRLSFEKRGGHGNAIAQSYNHTILPLSSERDRRTQIRWGIEDFRFRFKRDPESLWLPETACNDETLGALIDEGLKYVILSPYQAERVRPLGSEEWSKVGDGGVDPGRPYRYFHRDRSGRSIAIFFYDGHLARAIAFEGALASSRALVERFGLARGEGRVVNVATDGESYGHHHHLGDRGLAYALSVEAPSNNFWITNYGEFLERNPPQCEVEIKTGPEGEGTAWSCAHGVGRWIRDCSCQAGAQEGWNQKWRGPLRQAFDFLRDEAARHFEATEGDLFLDPWAARDDYIKLLVTHHRFREEFLYRHAGRWMQPAEKERALTFLEMQRHAMLMYTSCGWFFNDISGIETVQDMKYAGRVIDFLNELGMESPRERFLELLSEARSNLPEMGNGADIFRSYVLPSRALPPSVASTLAISSLMDSLKDEGELVSYKYRRQDFRRKQHGRIRLGTGRLLLESNSTGKQYDFGMAAMHFGGVDFYCALQPFPGEERFRESTEKLWSNFRTASLPTLLRLAQEEFGTNEYGLEHVLPEGRERISELVFKNLLKRFSDDYASLYKENRRRLEILQKAGFTLPDELRAAVEFTLAKQFEEEIERQERSNDPSAYQKAIKLAGEIARRGYKIDRSASRRIFEKMIATAVEQSIADPDSESFEAAISLINLTQKLGIEADLVRVQEAVYQALENKRVAPARIGELALSLGLSPVLLLEAHAEETGEKEDSAVEVINS